jgi:arylsulfatase A-like enzyme
VVAGVLWVPLFGRYTGVLKSAGEKAPAGSYKNVVFLLIDTQRRDFLDCYGAGWNASPVADRLAAEGAVFERHTAQSSWTLPSTASIMTGLFPSSHGAVAVAHPISPAVPTLAEAFQRGRYHTGAFVENMHILPRNGFGHGFDRFWAYWLPWIYDGTLLRRYAARLGLPLLDLAAKKDIPIPITHPRQVQWNAKVTTGHALAWLRGLDDSPFFIYLHYMGPHGPYAPPEFLLDREKPDVDLADHPRDTGGGYPLGKCGEAVDAETLQNIRTMYAADILYVDINITRLLDWLQETGKLEETLIVYTSDHGEEFYEHCGWNHGKSAFDEVLRVPFLVFSPGLVRRGLRVNELTRHVDVLPTILDLVGLDVPDNIHGRSLRPLLEGKAMNPVPAYSEVYPSYPPNCSIVSLVRGNHKLINVTLDKESAFLLYDLTADSLELNDLADSLSAVRDTMSDEILDWDLIARRYASGTDTIPLDERSLQRLKSLGYIQ